MKALLHEMRISLMVTLILLVVLCGAYPLVVWTGGQLFFHSQANGSLIVDADGTVRGSTRLAQRFTNERYFHPRPSAAGGGYDASNSGGSNLGPTSRKLATLIAADVVAYRAENNLPAGAVVPADAVTRSASGLDPHISLANARIQAVRVARARHISIERVMALVAKHTEDRGLHVLGEPGVNVLLLNRALDQAGD